MFNRKFNTRRDFSLLIELEKEIMPIIRKLGADDAKTLEDYTRKIFNNQFKQ